ncbi:AsnC family transcriptional regulator [Antricoccus suffuscus]|uniref:AsnC family transcriptional regulator n=1 Tax=Antricoccus suffuscus TaxID=1629062 RepID=A0A2T0ZXX1_9ACTN|nr:AsnC family transcriptional regulator [Antricoccus suffuscus]
MLAEEDFALIHALQVRPRATWTQLSEALGTSPVTLARRWARITSEGLAWVTAYPTWSAHGDSVIALVDVDCAGGRLDEVCTTLQADRRVMIIDQAASGRDLTLTVAATSFPELSRLLIDDLQTVPGIVSTRTYIAAQLYTDGSKWRLDALDRRQLRALSRVEWPPGSTREPQLLGAIPDSHMDLVYELSKNGRASAVELAHALGRPASTVRRQLTALLRARALTFRCEVAQLSTRWSIIASWWCRVPEERRIALVKALRTQPRVRLCASLTGPTNFVVTMWARSPDEIMRIQGWLEEQVPSIVIDDVSVILRCRKRMGWKLDPDGRATGEVVPVWPPAT